MKKSWNSHVVIVIYVVITKKPKIHNVFTIPSYNNNSKKFVLSDWESEFSEICAWKRPRIPVLWHIPALCKYIWLLFIPG